MDNTALHFRAWDRHLKRMDYNLDMLTVAELREVENLMRFTGSRDKDGKKIYEGDIMGGSTHTVNYNYLQVIYWDNIKCGFKSREIRGERKSHPMSSVSAYKRVVGNIYENKELLK